MKQPLFSFIFVSLGGVHITRHLFRQCVAVGECVSGESYCLDRGEGGTGGGGYILNLWILFFQFFQFFLSPHIRGLYGVIASCKKGTAGVSGMKRSNKWYAVILNGTQFVRWAV